MARGKKKESALTPEEKLAQALVPVEEQPYKVPDNWCWVSFASISQIRTGKKDANYGSEDGAYPFFTCAAEPIRCDGYSFDCNAILLAGNGDINNISRYEGKFEAYQRTYVVEVKEQINTDLMYYYFKYRWFDYNKDKMFGTAIPYIRLGNLQTFPVPLAPQREQQRIIDRIEYLFAKLDEAKEKAESVLDSFETRKAAILHKAFTGELTVKWRAEYGVEMESWVDETLQSVCSMKITDGTHKTPTYCDAAVGVPFISAKDVTGEVICWDNIKYIIPELHEELYARLAPQLDDILLAKNGTTGVAAIVDVDKVFDLYVTLAVLRPDKSKILPRYLLRIVNSPVCKNQFDEHLTGIGVPNLHLRDIKEVVIQVPSLSEQAVIIKVVDSIMKKEQQAKESAEAVLEKIDLLKKSILARAFRGELGTNDPAEESALELLKRTLESE